MYIPTCNDMQEHTLMAGEDTQQFDKGQPFNFEDWVKIALPDSLVVYAHKWNER
ncbi:hypothetical protein KSX_30750 [Ktedonospora formicarum]|uniref:Uncharacterized protein n=2 Tax=Ktedonospora formicarum TaxID=2778364 RepID=A0A8J3HVP0_9CHLR|nr:hypothetical protein KSX_30750 [Ktedonospora formicarum]